MLVSNNLPVLDYVYGQPIPTNSWVGQMPEYWSRESWDLKNFPWNDLPSGFLNGVPSGRLSPSEMFVLWTQVGRPGGNIGPVSHQWLRPDGSVMFTYEYVADPSWQWTWWWSFVGRFAGEVNAPGDYVCVVRALDASARFRFPVITTEAPQAQALSAQWS